MYYTNIHSFGLANDSVVNINVVNGIKDNNSHSFKINSLIIRDSIDHASKVARKLKINNMLQNMFVEHYEHPSGQKMCF